MQNKISEVDYHLRVCIGCITRVLVMLGIENFLKEKEKKEKEKQRTWLLYSISESGEHVESFKY